MGDRDEFWNTLWSNHYDSLYYSILYGELTKRWQVFDFLSKLLVAATASGSAVAGWALWESPEYKTIWIIIAGSASLISIVHSTLNVSEKLKKYVKLSNDMSEVSLEFEAIKEKIAIYPDFDVNEMYEKVQPVKKKYATVSKGDSQDFLTSKRIENKAQDILNEKPGKKE